MNFLLTNDDSHVSPLFEFAIANLQALGHVTIAVPKEEQSWTGKAISRFRYLYLDTIALHEGQAHCVDGTPADCINLGIYHVMPHKPDLVVSGINMGRNVGLGFVMSSGTIGACFEANIAGLPAVALSQDLERSLFQAWNTDRSLPVPEVARLRAQTESLLQRVFQMLFAQEGFWHTPITWNVNLPYRAAPDWRIVHTCLSQTVYGSCFKKIGDRFQHGLGPLAADTRDHVDEEAVRQGHVSLTVIDLRVLGQLENSPTHAM
jgi:5'-nucleotidase